MMTKVMMTKVIVCSGLGPLRLTLRIIKQRTQGHNATYIFGTEGRKTMADIRQS